MSLTFTKVKRWPATRGNPRHAIYDVTLDADMPAAGWVVTAANFRMNSLIDIQVPSILGFTGRFNPTASTIVYHEAAADDEVDTNELDAAVIRVHVWGN